MSTIKVNTLTNLAATSTVNIADINKATSVTYVPAGAGAVSTTVQAKLRESVSVKDFGAVGDGVTDDTAAIQAALTYIDSTQAASLGTLLFTTSTLHFPQGIYLITDALKCRGFIGLDGVGTPYTGGSVLLQTVAGKNIFEFYGSSGDARSLGTLVQGLNFQFAHTLGTSTGIALYYPKLNDNGVTIQASNSHYIRDNRFGGLNCKGSFLYLEGSDDVEISNNIVDVCAGPGQFTIKLGNSAVADYKCTSVRILGNNFYYSSYTIQCRNTLNVVISGNSFSYQYGLTYGWVCIDITAGENAIVVGRNQNLTIQTNSFYEVATAYTLDGSVLGVTIGGNTHSRAQQYIMTTSGATAITKLQWIGDSVGVNGAVTTGSLLQYPYTSILEASSCQIKESTIADLSINSDGLGISSLSVDVSSQSAFTTNMTLRNNVILNGLAYPGASTALVPCSARGLELDHQRTFGTTYPTGVPLFYFNVIEIDYSAAFDLDYYVLLTKNGADIAATRGKVRISFARMGSGVGTIKSEVVGISTVSDSYNNNPASYPFVAFNFIDGGAIASYIAVTISNAALTAPFTSLEGAFKASNFSSRGTVSIKCV